MAMATAIVFLSGKSNRSSLPYGFLFGDPEIKSISTMAFGPNGVLFIGDSKSGTVFAVDTKDVSPVDKASPLDMKNVDQKMAAFLGTEIRNISIRDLKVNPISKKIYCAVQSADGTPVLLKIENGNFQNVPLKGVLYSKIDLTDVPSPDVKNKWGGYPRMSSIEDLHYSDGKVMISGLSNQQFSSTFRSIPFPFTDAQSQTSLEIYHASHGRFETEAPIETFTTASLQGKKFLIASYTCTPLVLFPMGDLKPGAHVKGRTVAEFGAGNHPLDMITMKKGDDLYLIISNSDRPVMKVNYRDIEAYKESLTSQIMEPFKSAGVPYISFPLVNVIQLDKLDDTQFVFLQRKSNGDLDLRTENNEFL
jgi:hypothetical protein